MQKSKKLGLGLGLLLLVLLVVLKMTYFTQGGGQPNSQAVVLENVPKRHAAKLTSYLAQLKGASIATVKDLVAAVPVEVYRTDDAVEAVKIMKKLQDSFKATVKIV